LIIVGKLHILKAVELESKDEIEKGFELRVALAHLNLTLSKGLLQIREDNVDHIVFIGLKELYDLIATNQTILLKVRDIKLRAALI